ncbi:MAG: GNAT family protein [Ruminiclostridium sp.]|nr:GNAT family protein [Ruminiclostridium sp.]
MRLTYPIFDEHIIIRNYETDDLFFSTNMWFDDENGKYLSDPTAEYVDETYQKVLDGLADSPHGYYLIIERRKDNVKIGTCCAFPDAEKKVFDIGYCIEKNYWRQGFASTALKLLIEYIRSIGGERIIAEVAVENTASCSLLQKFGFEIEKEAEFKKYNMDACYKSYIYHLDI